MYCRTVIKVGALCYSYNKDPPQIVQVIGAFYYSYYKEATTIV